MPPKFTVRRSVRQIPVLADPSGSASAGPDAGGVPAAPLAQPLPAVAQAINEDQRHSPRTSVRGSPASSVAPAAAAALDARPSVAHEPAAFDAAVDAAEPSWAPPAPDAAAAPPVIPLVAADHDQRALDVDVVRPELADQHRHRAPAPAAPHGAHAVPSPAPSVVAAAAPAAPHDLDALVAAFTEHLSAFGPDGFAAALAVADRLAPLAAPDDSARPVSAFRSLFAPAARGAPSPSVAPSPAPGARREPPSRDGTPAPIAEFAVPLRPAASVSAAHRSPLHRPASVQPAHTPAAHRAGTPARPGSTAVPFVAQHRSLPSPSPFAAAAQPRVLLRPDSVLPHDPPAFAQPHYVPATPSSGRSTPTVAAFAAEHPPLRPSTRAFKSLTPFNGTGGGAALWLEDFERCATIADYREGRWLQLLCTKLTGPALTIVEADNPVDYVAARNLLEVRYPNADRVTDRSRRKDQLSSLSVQPGVSGFDTASALLSVTLGLQYSLKRVTSDTANKVFFGKEHPHHASLSNLLRVWSTFALSDAFDAREYSAANRELERLKVTFGPISVNASSLRPAQEFRQRDSREPRGRSDAAPRASPAPIALAPAASTSASTDQHRPQFDTGFARPARTDRQPRPDPLGVGNSACRAFVYATCRLPTCQRRHDQALRDRWLALVGSTATLPVPPIPPAPPQLRAVFVAVSPADPASAPSDTAASAAVEAPASPAEQLEALRLALAPQHPSPWSLQSLLDECIAASPAVAASDTGTHVLFRARATRLFSIGTLLELRPSNAGAPDSAEISLGPHERRSLPLDRFDLHLGKLFNATTAVVKRAWHRRLTDLGFYSVPVKGDGDCLLHSIIALSQPHTTPAGLRARLGAFIVSEVATSADPELAVLLTAGRANHAASDNHEYARIIATPRSHLGFEEIQLFARLLRRAIVVHCMARSQPEAFLPCTVSEFSAQPDSWTAHLQAPAATLHVEFVGSSLTSDPNHYNALRQLADKPARPPTPPVAPRRQRVLPDVSAQVASDRGPELQRHRQVARNLASLTDLATSAPDPQPDGASADVAADAPAPVQPPLDPIEQRILRNRSSMPTVPARLDSVVVTAGLDSGAEVSLISSDVFDAICSARAAHGHDAPPLDKTVLRATGIFGISKRLDLLGGTDLDIRVADEPAVSWPFLVVSGAKQSVLLGQDFLRAHGLSLYSPTAAVIRDSPALADIVAYASLVEPDRPPRGLEDESVMLRPQRHQGRRQLTTTRPAAPPAAAPAPASLPSPVAAPAPSVPRAPSSGPAPVQPSSATARAPATSAPSAAAPAAAPVPAASLKAPLDPAAARPARRSDRIAARQRQSAAGSAVPVVLCRSFSLPLGEHVIAATTRAPLPRGTYDLVPSRDLPRHFCVSRAVVTVESESEHPTFALDLYTNPAVVAFGGPARRVNMTAGQPVAYLQLQPDEPVHIAVVTAPAPDAPEDITFPEVLPVDAPDAAPGYTVDVRQQLLDLLQSARNTCNLKRFGPTVIGACDHVLQLADPAQPPIAVHGRTSHPARDEVLRQFGRQLLKDGIIENAYSKWCAPPHLVRKPGAPATADPNDPKTWRFVVDWTRLNAVTKPLASVLPKTEEMMSTLHDCVIFSKIDLKAAYHQLVLNESDRPKTAFHIKGLGYFQYRGLGMGLRNAVVTFHEYLRRLLDGIRGVQCYLDDILVATADMPSHLAALRDVFGRLDKAGLIISHDKTLLCRNNVPFMGFLITDKGIKLDPRKEAQLANLEPPRNRKQLKRVLGILNFLRGHMIKDASDAISELQDMDRAPNGFQSSAASDAAFARVVSGLLRAPTLHYPDPNGTYRVTTDASTFGLGAILEQLDPPSHSWVPVQLASRRLHGAEQRYHAIELEALAIYWALKRWEHILVWRPFEVLSDHRPLRKFTELRKSQRVHNWALALSHLSFTVHYRNGESNSLADWLSRLNAVSITVDDLDKQVPADGLLIATAATSSSAPPASTSPAAAPAAASSSTGPLPLIRVQPDSAIALHAFPTGASPVSRADVLAAQRADPTCRLIADMLASGTTDPLLDGFSCVDDLVYYTAVSAPPRLYLPEPLRRRSISDAHDAPCAGHPGATRTFALVSARFFWPSLRRDVTAYVLACQPCQFRKSAGHRAIVSNPITRAVPNDILCIDVIGPLPTTSLGNTYALTAVDSASHLPFAVPVPDTKSATLLHALFSGIFQHVSFPRAIRADNAANLLALIPDLDRLGIVFHSIPADSPNTNGLVERMHRSLKDTIAVLVTTTRSEWDQLLPHAVIALRSAPSSSTQLSPFLLHFGSPFRQPADAALLPAASDAVMPLGTDDLLDLVGRTRAALKATRRALLDKPFPALPVTYFAAGDEVLVRNSDPKGFGARYDGPYRVIKLRSNGHIVQLAPAWSDSPTDRIEVNVSQLKRYYRPPASVAAIQTFDKILSVETVQGTSCYKVKVLGRPLEDSIYVPCSELDTDFPALVRAFRRSSPTKSPMTTSPSATSATPLDLPDAAVISKDSSRSMPSKTKSASGGARGAPAAGCSHPGSSA